MTKGTFGDNLRREREMRGVSLDEISTATRIAPRFLVAIENEQWDELPGGVFNRGFVRAVAHYLGLDEESIVAEYALSVNDRPTVPVWTGTPPPLAPDRRWVNLIILAIVAIALVTGCWFTTRKILTWRARRATAKTHLSVAAVPPTPSDAAQNVMSAGPATVAADSASAPAAPTDTTATNSSSNSKSSPDSTAEHSTSSATSAPSDSPMQLKIETVKKTKVTVQTDAHRVFDGTVKTGDVHTFSAKDRFQISTRDAGALVIQLNGKTLAPIGPLGQPGKITLSREALKVSGGDN